MNKYKVRFFQNNEYEVVENTLYHCAPEYDYWTHTEYYYWTPYIQETKEVTVFKGSLSDCEAFIRLKEGGYM